MARATNSDKVYQILLRTAVEVTNAKYGLIRLLNYTAGKLEVIAVTGMSNRPPALDFGRGITWKALIEGKIQLADDVKSAEWKPYYYENVPVTASELAVPLLVEQVPVREGKKVKLRPRPLGVLNLESPKIGAFSRDDIIGVKPLVRQASLIIDGKEAEKKLKGLMKIDKSLVNKRNPSEVLDIVASGIKETLNFEWVNISLITQAGQAIKSQHVVGLSDEDAKEFKEMSNHSLDGEDIQASIVRTGDVEVVSGHDSRLDAKIFDRFGHKDLIRVFAPIFAPSTGEVIGTVEAGHRKDYRNFIDERDVVFLQAIIANAAEVIDPQERNMLARIRHELSTSIVGIRSHTDYLKQMRKIVRDDVVENKLSDILTDCDILLLNVEEIELLLGQPTAEGKIERVLVLRDIILKTINQLKPIIRERNFSTGNVKYPAGEEGRIKIYIEKAKLNQVVNNLLTNAIKYAKKDRPDDFRIDVTIEETSKEFILKFSDWGIGIKPEYKERIFKSGFRAPEAIALEVTGSGLGLVIARERMKEIGGNLILDNFSNPTVFHLRIPKSLREKPK